MIFKNAMSFKAKIKQVAGKKGITARQVQQNYLIEVFLTKLAKSKYKENFIVKGGYLIGGIVGLDMRATIDLDTTIKGFELTPENLSNIAKEIASVHTEESFELGFEGLEEIRKTDDYPGFRLKLIATFEKIRELVIIDVTTGDIITPKEIDFNFCGVFSDEKLELLTYPIETILAEKLEAILSRGIVTTRPRDYYDVYILTKLKAEQIDLPTLKRALENTKAKRQSVFEFSDYSLILDEIKSSDFQRQLWIKYQKQYSYAKDISFDKVIEATKSLLRDTIMEENNLHQPRFQLPRIRDT
jgi:predicted nucleotidyltransferase component of viral defense system